MTDKQLKENAEKFIKAKFVDYDHCATSARAVSMFIQGVEWALDKTRPTFGPDIDSDAEVFFPSSICREAPQAKSQGE